jgi:hypothetical protein
MPSDVIERVQKLSQKGQQGVEFTDQDSMQYPNNMDDDGTDSDEGSEYTHNNNATDEDSIRNEDDIKPMLHNVNNAENISVPKDPNQVSDTPPEEVAEMHEEMQAYHEIPGVDELNQEVAHAIPGVDELDQAIAVAFEIDNTVPQDS